MPVVERGEAWRWNAAQQELARPWRTAAARFQNSPLTVDGLQRGHFQGLHDNWAQLCVRGIGAGGLELREFGNGEVAVFTDVHGGDGGHEFLARSRPAKLRERASVGADGPGTVGRWSSRSDRTERNMPRRGEHARCLSGSAWRGAKDGGARRAACRSGSGTARQGQPHPSRRRSTWQRAYAEALG